MSDGCANCQELERQLRAARLSQPAAQPDQRRMQRIDTLAQLAAAVTHEYNNTIGVILTSSEMLLDSALADGQRADAERIRRAASRAREFTQRLATFGRARARNPAPLDCDAVIGELRIALAKPLHDATITLELSLESAPAVVVADRGQLETLIQSLIANARDAMPHGGVLRIVSQVVQIDERAAAEHAGSTAGAYVRIAVADTGAGVAEEIIDRIFEPFFSTKYRAMGLGLAAVYAIAKSLGGFVQVEHPAEGGACFAVCLPVARN
jgi:signal transduction histidine kinase